MFMKVLEFQVSLVKLSKVIMELFLHMVKPEVEKLSQWKELRILIDKPME